MVESQTSQFIQASVGYCAECHGVLLIANQFYTHNGQLLGADVMYLHEAHNVHIPPPTVLTLAAFETASGYRGLCPTCGWVSAFTDQKERILEQYREEHPACNGLNIS